MTLLPPPADTLVPAWQWFVATWFGSGLIEPLRAGLAVTIAGILIVGLSRKHALIVPVIGIAVVILGPAFLRSFHWAAIVVFGAVFLLIDRIKPWPFHFLEGLPAGWSVMADDLGLGIVPGAVFLALLATKRMLRHA